MKNNKLTVKKNYLLRKKINIKEQFCIKQYILLFKDPHWWNPQHFNSLDEGDKFHPDGGENLERHLSQGDLAADRLLRLGLDEPPVLVDVDEIR